MRVQRDAAAEAKRKRGTTDVEIRAWLRAGNVGKLVDGGALYLHRRTPSGAAVWRWNYRSSEGKEQTATIGAYPEITLAAARLERDRLRAGLRSGIDPSATRRQAAAMADVLLATPKGPTFTEIAGQWLASKRWGDDHAAKVRRSLDRDVFPQIGDRVITTITRAMVAEVLAKVMDREARETGSRIQQRVARILDFAIAKGLRGDNPASHTRGVLGDAPTVERRPALLELDPLRDILRRCDTLYLSRPVWLANRLIAFTASRVGPAISATWDEFLLDDECPRWIVPRERMKVKDGNKGDFVAYLGPALTSELQAWKLATGGEGHVFPSPVHSPTKHPHIEHAALNRLYTRTLNLGGIHCPHGWRSSLRSLGAQAGFAREPLELMLDHAIGDEVERAYQRYDYGAERRAIALWWESTLLQTTPDAKVLPLAKRA
jgi:integrase